MPRHARKKSQTGIYHIMLRGIDKRDVFIDDGDRHKFLENLKKAQEIGGFQTYGYCLMDNHIHLLLKEDEELGTSIKRITVGYVGWHNLKHERTGHLFQNRYISEPVETDSYLLTVLRYIHQNPVKAKMVNKAQDYPWSSYAQYFWYYQGKSTFIDGDLIRAYFNTFASFSDYMNADNNDECLEYKVVGRFTDRTLQAMISQEYDADNLQAMSAAERGKIISDIYHHGHTSIRQLSRVMGIGKAVIEKAMRQDK